MAGTTAINTAGLIARLFFTGGCAVDWPTGTNSLTSPAQLKIPLTH